jgi:hypothetical protein
MDIDCLEGQEGEWGGACPEYPPTTHSLMSYSDLAGRDAHVGIPLDTPDFPFRFQYSPHSAPWHALKAW